MKCPFCGNPDSKVIDSRITRDGSSVRRRRECLSCRERFTTYEQVEEIQLMVIKKDGRREPYERKKVMEGILKACEKRPVSMGQIENFVDSLGKEIGEKGVMEVESRFIGERVMGKLKEWDDVAYVRFASVYKQFKDLTEFMAQLQELLKEETGKNAKGA